MQKSVQDLLVDLRHNLKKIHVPHNLCSDNLESIWSANLLEKCEYVKFLFLNVKENICSWFELLNLWVQAWISASGLSFCTLWITLPLRVQTFSDWRFSEALHSKRRKFIQPPLCDRWPPLHGKIERVEQRVINVKDGTLSNLVNCIIDPLNHVLMRVIDFACEEIILDLSEHLNDLLSRSPEEITVIDGFDLLLRCREQFHFKENCHFLVWNELALAISDILN